MTTLTTLVTWVMLHALVSINYPSCVSLLVSFFFLSFCPLSLASLSRCPFGRPRRLLSPRCHYINQQVPRLLVNPPVILFPIVLELPRFVLHLLLSARFVILYVRHTLRLFDEGRDGIKRQSQPECDWLRDSFSLSLSLSLSLFPYFSPPQPPPQPPRPLSFLFFFIRIIRLCPSLY